MSSKINIIEIVTGHFRTLLDVNGRLSKSDVFTFMLVPLFAGFLSVYLGFNLNGDLSSLLVNFGSIFTALLLSVLVLVYDQEAKLEQAKEREHFYLEKKDLLKQLYYNISFSIICSVLLVVSCFIHSTVKGAVFESSVKDFVIEFHYDVYLFTPLAVILAVSLVLNILMVLKRMHTLLVTN